jgi:hypothetical protein
MVLKNKKTHSNSIPLFLAMDRIFAWAGVDQVWHALRIESMNPEPAFLVSSVELAHSKQTTKQITNKQVTSSDLNHKTLQWWHC